MQCDEGELYIDDFGQWLATDYGSFPVPRNASAMYQAAKKRRNGFMVDRRTKLGRTLKAWELEQVERLREARTAGHPLCLCDVDERAGQ